MHDDTTVTTAEPQPPVRLSELAAVFFRIGLGSFGGGLIAWIHRDAVERRNWMNDAEFLSGYALCRILPGANIINFAVYLGVHLRGLIGATTALLSLVVPPAIIGIAIYEIYEHYHGIGAAQFVLDGVAATAAGLNVATAAKALQRSKNAVAAIVAIAVFVAVGLLHWPMLWVVCAAAPISVALAWRSDSYG
jgi:chromate transporter